MNSLFLHLRSLKNGEDDGTLNHGDTEGTEKSRTFIHSLGFSVPSVSPWFNRPLGTSDFQRSHL